MSWVDLEIVATEMLRRLEDAVLVVRDALIAAFSAVREAVERIARFFGWTPSFVGRPLAHGTRPVRPVKGSRTWLAWRDGYWIPVRRISGSGWVWSA